MSGLHVESRRLVLQTFQRNEHLYLASFYPKATTTLLAAPSVEPATLAKLVVLRSYAHDAA
jgi:hypothetical protein